MDIKYLKLIQTIYEEGNISRSADRLFLTQSALSHQLREIEDQLGFKIFLRSRNNWKLTEEGQELYDLSVKVLSDIEKSLNKVQNIRSGSAGTIRMSTECYSFYHGLPAFIQRMGILYPNIDIQLIIESTHHPVSKMIAGELDIGIVTSIIQHDELEYSELFTDEIFAVMNVEHRLSGNDYITASDFKDIHLIIHSYPLDTVSVHKLFLTPNQINPVKITAIPMTEVALEMVVANMGVICLPKWALSTFKLPETITFRPIGSKGLKRKHYLVYRKEDLSKKHFRDLVNNIRDDFIH